LKIGAEELSTPIQKRHLKGKKKKNTVIFQEAIL